MKQGRRPNRKQKIAMERCGLNYEKWLVFKIIEGNLHLVHREAGTTKIIPVS